MTPSMTEWGLARTSAGPVIGQASTHFPQRVHAAAMASVRAASAVSNALLMHAPGREPSLYTRSVETVSFETTHEPA